MNNKDFISELSQREGYNLSNTQRLVSAIVDAMADSFQEDNSIMVANFGTFEVKKKMERIMTNPATQQRMLVPPKLVLNFKPNRAWKEKLPSGGSK